MSSSTLVFVLHGFANTPKRFASVKQVINSRIPQAEVVIPLLPISRRFSLATPNQIVLKLLEQIDNYWATNKYSNIVLIGHSMGALLARKLYISACGSTQKVPLEPDLLDQCTKPREWAESVDRIVLLAGMNGGWSVDYHMSLLRGAWFSAGSVAAACIRAFTGKSPAIMSARRGSVFLTQLRLQWFEMRRMNLEGRLSSGKAPVIQLLGTVDDLVSPRDNVDPNTGGDFFFFDVPKTGHSNVIDMGDTTEGKIRAECLTNALIWDKKKLANESESPSDVAPLPRDDSADEVVFVMHGIRDEGFWTDKIARAVIKEGRSANKRIASETSTYGFFGMLPFLLAPKRQQKVEWFMDLYSKVRIRYPNATKFHYVGHSNGTYIVAKAIADYPCCVLENVVFAGSVVSSKFDWHTPMGAKPPQVQRVLNYAATSDVVVAGFPNCFEYFGFKDLGGAGHKGFDPLPKSGVENVEYVVGAHSAAIQEDNWKDIANFVVHGHLPPGFPAVKMANTHSWFATLIGKFPPLAWLLAAAVVAFIGLILYAILYPIAHDWHVWWFVPVMMCYGAIVYFVGTRL